MLRNTDTYNPFPSQALQTRPLPSRHDPYLGKGMDLQSCKVSCLPRKLLSMKSCSPHTYREQQPFSQDSTWDLLQRINHGFIAPPYLCTFREGMSRAMTQTGAQQRPNHLLHTIYLGGTPLPQSWISKLNHQENAERSVS